jgi:hypothetical protein
MSLIELICFVFLVELVILSSAGIHHLCGLPETVGVILISVCLMLVLRILTKISFHRLLAFVGALGAC